MSAVPDVEGYRQVAASGGHRAVVIGSDDSHEEIVLRGSTIASHALTTERGVTLAYGERDRTTYVAADASMHPEDLAARARDALRLLPGHAAAPREYADDPRDVTALPARSGPLVSSLVDHADSWRCALEPLGDVEVEMRTTVRRRVVAYADGRLGGTRHASRTTVVLRVTARSADGTTHLVRSGVVATPADVLGLLRDVLVPRAVQEITLPRASPTTVLPATGWPDLVILDGQVAAQLVALVGKSFSAESVQQQRSALAGSLARRIAATGVCLADDPVIAGGVVHGAFDDEGVPTARRLLVEDGILRSYLGTTALARQVTGAFAGNAWQSNRVSPPRPNGTSLHLTPSGRTLDLEASTVRVVQSHGLHMANDITGDFSLGATAVVLTADGPTLVSGLTVAGNVLQFLRDVHALGDRLAWSPGSVATYGAPDVLVSGLAVGF
ncbi:MAG: hypothetical protein J7503_06660 [Cellulomonas iranensis]|uniref:metallopeptidase TldD-related protein n=1 Tax=Cellulomonas iranensis TaxID=76862 RepID=UPI001B1657C5|nr:metallopeptidase TldD-related protein [Cellulomonas iranensis]MBO9568490.1 hypothetical protein [Cellulomonas iranensis]